MPKRADQDPDDATLGSLAPADNPAIAFADADWSWFLGRCAALGIPGAEERRSKLESIYGHLVGVNRWLNLTKLTSPREYLKLHILDSLVAEGDPRLKHLSEGSPCVDLGSGGGYPGLPLAAWHPTVPWVLVDSRQKKVEFLAAACALTGNPRATARHLRGGEVAIKAPELRRNCQLVTCRAMGQTDEILREASDLLHKSGHLLIYKGPAFAGDERNRALVVCQHLGFRLVNERKVVLEDGDPERLLVAFVRER